MRKFFVTLIIGILLAGFVGSAWAAGTRPEGAVSVKPHSAEWVSGGQKSGAQASFIIPPQPWVDAYFSYGPEGAQLGTSVYAEFPIHAYGLWIDGVFAGAMRGLFVGGSLPKGVSYSEKAQFTENLGFHLPFIFSEGEYKVQVGVFPTADLGAYWLFTFQLKVDPFDFWLEVCLPTGSYEKQEILLAYHLVGKDLPRLVSVVAGDQFLGLAAVGEDGVATLRIAAAAYAALAGQELRTTVNAGGKTIVRNLWYPPLEHIGACGGKG